MGCGVCKKNDGLHLENGVYHMQVLVMSSRMNHVRAGGYRHCGGHESHGLTVVVVGKAVGVLQIHLRVAGSMPAAVMVRRSQVVGSMVVVEHQIHGGADADTVVVVVFLHHRFYCGGECVNGCGEIPFFV